MYHSALYHIYLKKEQMEKWSVIYFTLLSRRAKHPHTFHGKCSVTILHDMFGQIFTNSCYYQPYVKALNERINECTTTETALIFLIQALLSSSSFSFSSLVQLPPLSPPSSRAGHTHTPFVSLSPSHPRRPTGYCQFIWSHLISL